MRTRRNTVNRRANLNEITQAGEHVMKNVRGFVDGAEELLRATAHFSGENLAAARARMAEQVDELRDALGDATEYATDQAKHAAVTTDRYVRRNPWQAIGIAMATGVVIGYLSRRN
jgi:ElaB/YqjD/DUF883 family membrane-anchored ribosome-binding protein